MERGRDEWVPEGLAEVAAEMLGAGHLDAGEAAVLGLARQLAPVYEHALALRAGLVGKLVPSKEAERYLAAASLLERGLKHYTTPAIARIAHHAGVEFDHVDDNVLAVADLVERTRTLVLDSRKAAEVLDEQASAAPKTPTSSAQPEPVARRLILVELARLWQERAGEEFTPRGRGGEFAAAFLRALGFEVETYTVRDDWRVLRKAGRT